MAIMLLCSIVKDRKLYSSANNFEVPFVGELFNGLLLLFCITLINIINLSTSTAPPLYFMWNLYSISPRNFYLSINLKIYV